MKINVIITLCFLVLSVNSFSQDSKAYNLPPGTQLRSGKFEKIDYSYKLMELPVGVSSRVVYEDFLKNWSDEELEELKNNNKKKYAYYMKAQAYHHKLAEKIKGVFTFDELWYIYMFDEELKQKLSKIK